MDLKRLWFGDAPAERKVVGFHDSTLESLRVATELQQASTLTEWTMRVAAVYRGAQLLSDLAAQLPWAAYDGGRHSGQQVQEGAPERLDTQPALLLRPDPFETRGDFIRQIVLSLVFTGNAYLYRSGINEAGNPTSVQVLNPSEMNVSWNELRTRRVYHYRTGRIPSAQLDHLRLNSLPGDLVGTGPITAISETISGQIAADRFARDLFTSGGIPTGLLEYPGKLNADEAKELLRVWNVAQEEARKTAVLSGGTTYTALSLSPDQAQMLQTRSFGVSEIGRALGIPAHLLNAATGVAGASGASMTYTNTQDIFRELLKTTLFPVYLERIAETASLWLPRGQSVRFDDRDLLRADTASRWNAAKVAIDAGFLTVDEIREAEGLPPNPEIAAERARKQALAEKIASGGTTDDEEGSDAEDRASSSAQ